MPGAPGVRNLSLFLAPFVLNAALLAREIKTRTGNMLDKTKNVNTIVRLIRFLGNFAETFFLRFSFKVAIFFFLVVFPVNESQKKTKNLSKQIFLTKLFPAFCERWSASRCIASKRYPSFPGRGNLMVKVQRLGFFPNHFLGTSLGRGEACSNGEDLLPVCLPSYKRHTQCTILGSVLRSGQFKFG